MKPVVSINRPRFEDSDFESREKSVIPRDSQASQDSLGISERGQELLRGVNEILDNMSEIPADGASPVIVLRFPGQAERSGRYLTDGQR